MLADLSVSSHRTTIGRDPVWTVCLPDDKVSSLHAEVTEENGTYRLRALGSAGDVQVNGAPVQEAILNHGDQIAIGDTLMVFESLEDPATEDQSPGVPPVLFDSAEAPVNSVTIDMPTPDNPLTLIRKEAGLEETKTGKQTERRLQTLWKVSRTASLEGDVSSFLRDVVLLVAAEIHSDAMVVLLRDEGSGELKPALVQCAENRPPDESLTISSTVVQRVLRTGKSYLGSDSELSMTSSASIRTQRIRSVMCVPLKVRDKSHGVFYVDVRTFPGIYTRKDLAFLSTVCTHLAVNIENQALYRASIQANERLQKAQQQLLATERLRVMGLLAASVAHELGTPVQCIRLAAESLQRELAADRSTLGEEKIHEVLAMIVRAGKRCGNLVQGIQGEIRRSRPSERGSFSIGAPVSEAIRLMQHLARKKEVRIFWDLPADLPPIVGDAGEIEQVLINLLKNAIDSIPSDGEIKITGRGDDGWLRVAVQDTGTGIDEEHLKNVFDELFTTKAPGDGTGIGLPLCRTIMERHGGAIQLQSKAGEGTTVLLSFPIGAEPAPA